MKKSENIIWTLEGKITDKEKYAEAMKTLTEKSYTEEGTLTHWWTVAEDDETFHVYERYADPEETMKHLMTWNQYGHLFLESTEISRFTVYSELTDELKEAVAGLNPVYMKPYGGFSK